MRSGEVHSDSDPYVQKRGWDPEMMVTRIFLVQGLTLYSTGDMQ